MSRDNIRIPVNEKRGKAKQKRGRGLLAMKGADPVAWCQSKDPLFKVKGKERHRLRMR